LFFVVEQVAPPSLGQDQPPPVTEITSFVPNNFMLASACVKTTKATSIATVSKHLKNICFMVFSPI
jgi:hypothetical protein